MKLFLSTAFLLSSATAFAPSSNTLPKTKTALQNDLWGEPPQKEGETEKEMSKALPFAPRPKLLDGSLAGDVGFEYVFVRLCLHVTSPNLFLTYSFSQRQSLWICWCRQGQFVVHAGS